MKLGAEKWIDFKESEDLIKDVQAASSGGPQAAVVLADDVSSELLVFSMSIQTRVNLPMGLGPVHVNSMMVGTIDIIPICTNHSL